VPIIPGDTPASLHERIKAVERRLYPATIRSVIEGAATQPGDLDVPTNGAGSILEEGSTIDTGRRQG
jgi:folate-dependent phosphoribosylglycinamide formyltransferase PurN